MRSLVFYIGAFFFSWTVGAEPGFFKLTEPLIPRAVREASFSVFRITAQGGAYRAVEMTDLSEIQRLLSAKGSASFEGLQIEHCQREGLILCPLFESVTTGSAFLFQRPGLLATNLHTVFGLSKFLKDYEGNLNQSYRKPIKTPLLLRLRDKNGTVVFSSGPKESAHLELANLDFAAFASPELMSSPRGHLSDVVRFELSQKFKNFLTPAADDVLPGTSIFLLSFPGLTKDRQVRFQAPDSDGQSQLASIGFVLPFHDWLRRTKLELTPQQAELFKKHFVFSDLDCTFESRGGPLLNSKGEVIAILVAVDKDESTGGTLCRGLKLNSERALLDLWISIHSKP